MNNVIEEIVNNLDINSVDKEGVVVQQGEKAEKVSDNAPNKEIALKEILGSINKHSSWNLDSRATRHITRDRGK